MALASANRLLPWLAAILLALLGLVALRACSGDPARNVVMESVPRAPVPDADTPADTIKTLTANVAAMTAEVEALRQEGDRLRQENRDLAQERGRLEENLMRNLRRELRALEHEQETRRQVDSGVLETLTQRVDALAQSLAYRPADHSSELPVGSGRDPGEAYWMQEAGTVWVEPLDAAPGAREPVQESLLYPHGRADAPGTRVSGMTQPLKPAYTVPRNATLLGSTTLTALVGRIPVRGQVRDAMPFKVITGHENLAANGLTVPGIRGMVWSGTAIGDWTLSCVTGRLDSVTFVFDDGTIRTISGDAREGASASGERPLGWISDSQGIPCISGTRKTNAPAFLGQRIGMMTVQAAAEAAAAAQTTTTVRETGAGADSVTGDTGAYVLGKTVSGGTEEVARWLMERQSQSFDAVFVPAGTRVAIHVDARLDIDLEPQGRRLDYAQATDPHIRTRLD